MLPTLQNYYAAQKSNIFCAVAVRHNVRCKEAKTFPPKQPEAVKVGTQILRTFLSAHFARSTLYNERREVVRGITYSRDKLRTEPESFSARSLAAQERPINQSDRITVHRSAGPKYSAINKRRNATLVRATGRACTLIRRRMLRKKHDTR